MEDSVPTEEFDEILEAENELAELDSRINRFNENRVACPSPAAINIRAGWSMGIIGDTYLRHQAAGDMHVGRTVAGLPNDSVDFEVLPPQFNGDDQIVEI